MNQLTITGVITLVLSLLLSPITYGQSFGTNASAVWLTDCNQSNYWNTSGTGPSLIGPAGNAFNNADLGVYTQNSGSLILRGGEVRTFKTPAVSNVCSVKMYYRIYLQSATPGSFSQMDLAFVEDCNIPSLQFPSGGACIAGDQKWNRVIPDGATTPYAPINLTAFAPGSYTLEVYYEVAGSATTTTACDETVLLNNGGANYKANFSIQAPTLTSLNPSTCNGTEGVITVHNLAPGATYAISYYDDGNPIGPLNLVANASGQIQVTGLNAGIYSEFQLVINGCTTMLNTGVILSNPVFTPTFNSFPPFCAGSTAPVLPTTSNNGLTGTWNPAVVNNMASGSYTFTPAAGQCGIPITRNITVIQPTVPTFSFGTSLTICGGGSVPALPNTSTNGINGTWSPATVDDQNSGTYTFTPAAGLCASPTSFTVTVNPTITPAFSFGTSLTICAGETVPALPNTSDNGISGTWSPASVDNQNSATYTFTPAAGQCAPAVTFDVTVNPIVTPTFSFGTSLSICAGGSVPALPNTSDNGIPGSWSPAIADNQASGTYTFTPSVSCAPPVTFSVTVAPNITPSFSIGTSLTICDGGTVPALPTTSGNGFTGTWSPSTIDNTSSATYTFTPDAGQCATTASFSVTVNPNLTPSFSFGTSLAICTGGTVPALPGTSTNGFTGVWSPATVDNQASGVYTFTPDAGQCATTATFMVTVSSNTTPSFAFGSTLTICAGGTAPSLPSVSDNGVTGTWNPVTVDNQNSGTYTFTPDAGQCALPVTFSVTVNPNITPTFSFGTALSICAGETVPALPNTSDNGITGTWSPAVVDNQNSAVYTFTPSAGLCALTTSFNVTVTANVTPVFSFGTSMTICEGGSVPALSTTSNNGITGTWSPSTIDNQTSGTYTFTPSAGQCATTTTFVLTVTPNTIPTFAFGTTLTICAGETVPALPNTSDNGISGTWNPATVDNQTSAVYTFTPDAVPGACIVPVTFTVTVNPILTPQFSFGTTLSLCAGDAPPALPTTSQNGITGVWSPSVINNQASAVYTFTTDPGQCAEPGATLNVTVNPVPTGGSGSDTTVFDGDAVPANVLTGSPANTSFNWTNNNTSTGLAASGTGNIPSFIAINRGADPVVSTITVTPVLNGCAGQSLTYRITVRPLDKDVFVPNVFSPNGDGKNDLLMVYGNYIDRIDMRIFNQWGEQIDRITDKTRGWDGRFKGKPQPVGVYVYVLQAQLSDGRIVNLKGSITLIR